MTTFQLTHKDDTMVVILNGRRASRTGVRGPVDVVRSAVQLTGRLLDGADSDPVESPEER